MGEVGQEKRRLRMIDGDDDECARRKREGRGREGRESIFVCQGRVKHDVRTRSLVHMPTDRHDDTNIIHSLSANVNFGPLN